MSGVGRIGLVVIGVATAVACGGTEGGGEDNDGTQPMAQSPAGNSGGSGSPPMTSNDTGGSSSGGAGAPGGGGSAGTQGTPSGQGGDPEQPVEELDPAVDWEAFTLVYGPMYSAYVEGITFQVPVYVRDIDLELSDWSAIPSRAVNFDADPDSGGVLVTVLEPVAEITIAARSGNLGGTATLFVTEGTVEQWEAGKARYANGVELNIQIDPTMTLEELINSLDPNYTPPPPPDDLACNNCHTTGAKYFEIQHTPTQAARFSDDDLKTILTQGMKPEGVEFRVLPEMLFNMSREELYAEFHTWTATDEELTGLIVYLRSLTPAGQGDILLPDGTYVEPGSTPPGL